MADAAALLERLREPIDTPLDAEQAVLARVGRALYEQLFAGYTRKQWVREPCTLAPSVTARIPVRTDEDLRYFTDPFQGVPDRGYTAMVRRILDHPRIEVVLRCDYRELVGSVRFSRMVYTGPLDSFFDGAYGACRTRGPGGVPGARGGPGAHPGAVPAAVVTAGSAAAGAGRARAVPRCRRGRR